MFVSLYQSVTYDWFVQFLNVMRTAETDGSWFSSPTFASGPFVVMSGSDFETDTDGKLVSGTFTSAQFSDPYNGLTLGEIALDPSEATDAPEILTDYFGNPLPLDPFDIDSVKQAESLLDGIVDKKLTVLGSAEDDYVVLWDVGSKFTHFKGGEGNDTGFLIFKKQPGEQVFFGGEGEDTADMSDAKKGAVVNLKKGIAKAKGTKNKVKLDSVENVVGTEKDDKIKGDKKGNTIYLNGGDDSGRGGAGDDTIFSGSGLNFIWGEGGNDTVTGGIGMDIVDGGAGSDLLNTGAGKDRLNGGGGDRADDILTGGSEGDIFTFEIDGTAGFGNDLVTDLEDIDQVRFFRFDLKGKIDLQPWELTFGEDGEGNATVTIGESVATFHGLTREEFLATRSFKGITKPKTGEVKSIGASFEEHDGSKRDDVLYGGSVINGKKGDDTLGPGASTDVIIGGKGTDTFDMTTLGLVTNPSLRIADYETGESIRLFGDTYIGPTRNGEGDIVLTFDDGKTVTLDNTSGLEFSDLTIVEL